jgi:hypothetical protein
VKTAVEGVADDVEVDLQDESNCILTMVLNQGVEEKMPPRELEDELFGLLLYVSSSAPRPPSHLLFYVPFMLFMQCRESVQFSQSPLINLVRIT